MKIRKTKDREYIRTEIYKIRDRYDVERQRLGN